MGKSRNHRELEVLQKAMDWAQSIYLCSREFSREELYGLTAQLRKAEVSVPSNIAEGAERATTKDFLHLVSIAQGSLAEAETQLMLAARLGWLENGHREELLSNAQTIRMMLSGLRRALQAKLKANP